MAIRSVGVSSENDIRDLILAIDTSQGAKRSQRSLSARLKGALVNLTLEELLELLELSTTRTSLRIIIEACDGETFYVEKDKFVRTLNELHGDGAIEDTSYFRIFWRAKLWKKWNHRAGQFLTRVAELEDKKKILFALRIVLYGKHLAPRS